MPTTVKTENTPETDERKPRLLSRFSAQIVLGLTAGVCWGRLPSPSASRMGGRIG